MSGNLKRLHKGDYNTMVQTWLPDGTVQIRLIDHRADKVYKFRVKDFQGPNEEEVDYETGQSLAK